jgi:hypothetical protein
MEEVHELIWVELEDGDETMTAYWTISDGGKLSWVRAFGSILVLKALIGFALADI